MPGRLTSGSAEEINRLLDRTMKAIFTRHSLMELTAPKSTT